MPALTPEQEALKAAAMQFKVHGMFTSSHGRFNELANVDAILAILARLETVQEGVSTLPSTPLPGSALQGGEQDDDVKVSGRGGRYVPVAVRDALREEVIDLHRQLAAEKLHADQGWRRYEAANRSRQATENQLAAIRQPVQAVPDGWRDLIEWLLGKKGPFPTRNSATEGLYWWRKELRVRYEKLAGAAPGEPSQ